MTSSNFLRAAALAAMALALFIASCGGSSSSPSNGPPAAGIAAQVAACEAALPQLSMAGLANNEAAVIVDAGPCAYGVPYGSPSGTAAFLMNPVGAVNIPYTSVTVCVPGTATCQTIDHVLVDTGSVGMRILSSVLNANMTLPAVPIGGNPLIECAQFASGWSWGSVRTATVQIGGTSNTGETASSINVQVIGDQAVNGVAAPSTCSSAGTAQNDVIAYSANGILGVGLFVNDCSFSGSTCFVPSSPYIPLYWTCPGSVCNAIAVPSASIVSN